MQQLSVAASFLSSSSSALQVVDSFFTATVLALFLGVDVDGVLFAAGVARRFRWFVLAEGCAAATSGVALRLAVARDAVARLRERAAGLRTAGIDAAEGILSSTGKNAADLKAACGTK